MTGVRRGPVDRRRVRGAHVGIKRMLVEGMRVRSDRQPYSWKEFSDAMVRQSVGDAMTLIDRGDAQIVKLAYFGGLSNTEIARHTGMNETAVQRRLRIAIAAISHHVERGRNLGQRIVAAVAVWLTARSAADMVQGAVQGAAVVTAAAIIATHPAPALGLAHPRSAPADHAPAAAAVVPPLPTPSAPVSADARPKVPAAAPAQTAVSTVTSSVPSAPAVQAPAGAVPVQLPPVPSVPAPSASGVTTKVKKLV
jgi:Sigma-70, region 4